MTTLRLAPILLVAALLGACVDPVHQDEVDALGEENPNIRKGPLHRAGQPCLVCHGGDGPGDMVMSVAGTIYEHSDLKAPAISAFIKLTDATGTSELFETNCAGNFFVQAVDWVPAFPVKVVVTREGLEKEMQTHIGRDGSCASCHTGKETPSSVKHVYLTDEPSVVIGSVCKP